MYLNNKCLSILIKTKDENRIVDIVRRLCNLSTKVTNGFHEIILLKDL